MARSEMSLVLVSDSVSVSEIRGAVFANKPTRSGFIRCLVRGFSIHFWMARFGESE